MRTNVYNSWFLNENITVCIAFVCCSFHILATSKVIWGQVLNCDSAESWPLYNAAPLGDQTAISMTWYQTQSYYPDTEPSIPCPVLIMPSAWLWSSKYQFWSHWLEFEPSIFRSPDLPKQETDALLIQPFDKRPILDDTLKGERIVLFQLSTWSTTWINWSCEVGL